VLTQLLRFEWRYHTRQYSFAAAVLFFVAFGFALAATGFGPANVNVNSPYSVVQSLGMISLASLFAIAVFCASSVVRDREHLMEEIVFSTSVEKFPYLFSRFAGSFLAAFSVVAASAVGMMIAAAMPWQDPARVGPVALIPTLWALLILVLPGMLVIAVTLFGIATLTRSVLASVVGAVAIYVFYFAAAALTNSPLLAASAAGTASSAGASLLDPFGLAPFFEQTRDWTPIVRNHRLVSLTGMFLLNRVLWLLYTATAWLIIYRRFSFRVLARSKTSVVNSDAEPTPTSAYRATGVSGGPHADWSALAAAVRIEVRSVLRSVPFLLLTLLWSALAAMEILADVAGGEYGAAYDPTAGLILATLRQPLSLVATVILIYYSAELIWRERAVGMSEILNATPAPNRIFVVSKWIALSSMVVVLVSSGIGVGIAIQLAHHYPIQPAVMLGFACILAVPLMLFAMAAVLIQTLSPSKYFGMLAVLVAGVVVQAGGSFGLDHPLLTFGGAPPLQYSDMNGFGVSAAPFAWFMTLWTVVGLLMLLAASALWRRASSDRSMSALRAIARNSTPAGRWLGAILTVVFFMTGAFLFYNTNVLNRWSSRSTILDWSAGYERNYRGVSTLPIPHIAATTADIALDPRDRRYRVKGAYDLVNDTASAIETVLVSVPRDAHVTQLVIPAATLIRRDDRFATFSFRLVPPMQPHARTTLQFDLTYEHRGFSASAPDNSITANGSFITAGRSLPTLGYRRAFEITDPAERKSHALPPTARPGDDSQADDGDVIPEWTNVDITLSTEGDQIALSPGRLVNEWMSNGRRYFHYRSDGPIHNNLIFASARYAVATATAGNVQVSIYYHPQHRQNVPRIVSAAVASIRAFERDFGPWPQSQLRIAEAPAEWRFGGLAMPGLVFLNESRAFLIDASDPSRIDLIARRTAHEVSHQWWGHFVTPAVVPGASIIIEALPRYSELLLLDQIHGRPSVRRSLAFELDRYLSGRATDKAPEVPLTGVTDQAYLYYGKGAVVMNGVKSLMGEATLNRALRNFVTQEGGAGHQATIEDLINAIEAVAPTEQHAMIGEWFREIIVYDLSMQSATSRGLPDGRFEVTAQLLVRKLRADPTGTEVELPVDESVEIGIFTKDPDEAGADSVLHLAAHHVHTGLNTVSIVVDKLPAVAAIDPYITRIDRERFDNVKPVVNRTR
jgi:ABC-2 type transport system permease protein